MNAIKQTQHTVILTKGKESWGHTFIKGQPDYFEANGKFITTAIIHLGFGTSQSCLAELDMNNKVVDWGLWTYDGHIMWKSNFNNIEEFEEFFELPKGTAQKIQSMELDHIRNEHQVNVKVS